MATTLSPDSDGGDGSIVAVLKDQRYGYLGRDKEGDHHHYDQQEDVIYVTTDSYEDFVPEGTCLYHYRIKGEVVRKVDLTDEGLEDKDHRDWVAYVREERGWEYRPTSMVQALAEIFEAQASRCLL